jgi:hypothetical protein
MNRLPNAEKVHLVAVDLINQVLVNLPSSAVLLYVAAENRRRHVHRPYERSPGGACRHSSSTYLLRT